MKSECNNSTDEAIESAGTRETRPRPNKKGEHCKMDCKFDGEDEKKGDMIQCCLCNIWFHVECIMVTKTKGITDRIIIEDTENNETTTIGSSSTAENLGVAHQPTDQCSLESQTTKLLDEQPEDTESQDPNLLMIQKNLKIMRMTQLRIPSMFQVNLILKVTSIGISMIQGG